MERGAESAHDHGGDDVGQTAEKGLQGEDGGGLEVSIEVRCA
jgi:hypothetical protein